MTPPRIIPVGEELPPIDPPPALSGNGRQWHWGNGRGKAKGKPATPRERFQTLNAFVDFTLTGLSRAEIAVWLILYRDTKNGTVQTAMADMARRAGCTARQVVRAVARLDSLGLVEVVRRGGLRQGPSCYRVYSLVKRG